MRWGRVVGAFALAGLLGACVTAGSGEQVRAAACAKKPPGPKDIGVVLLHGKLGNPNNRNVTPLRWALEDAGYTVAAPWMPWAGTRNFDKTYQDAMGEIDAAVAELRAKGAKRVVVDGHSMGANAAFGYGATRRGLAGIVAIAPGDSPDRYGPGRATERLLPYVAEARRLVASGKGDETAELMHSTYEGEWSSFHVTPRIYLSYLDPQGPAVIPRNAAALEPGTPLLWIEASGETDSTRGANFAYDKAPTHPKNAFVYVQSDHYRAATESAPTVVAWLNCL